MNLISKKDLLAITGISYGQLYRWKRERLIPEEWFIKQSAYTGQETFFPREQILSRITSILELKDAYSLEELARILSPQTSVATISKKDLLEVDEFDKEMLDVMPEIFGKDEYEFIEVALSISVAQAAKRINLTDDELKELLKKSISTASKQKNANVTCTIFYSDGQYHTVFTSNQAAFQFDSSIEIKDQFSLTEVTDAIKIRYKSLFAR